VIPHGFLNKDTARPDINPIIATAESNATRIVISESSANAPNAKTKIIDTGNGATLPTIGNTYDGIFIFRNRKIKIGDAEMHNNTAIGVKILGLKSDGSIKRLARNSIHAKHDVTTGAATEMIIVTPIVPSSLMRRSISFVLFHDWNMFQSSNFGLPLAACCRLKS